MEVWPCLHTEKPAPRHSFTSVSSSLSLKGGGGSDVEIWPVSETQPGAGGLLEGRGSCEREGAGARLVLVPKWS